MFIQVLRMETLFVVNVLPLFTADFYSQLAECNLSVSSHIMRSVLLCLFLKPPILKGYTLF